MLFFEEPSREFNVREVARILKMAPPTASKELKVFSKESVLKERDERNLILYKANLDSDYYRDLKVFYNIRKIRTILLDKLNKFYLKPTIVLFGSASLGMDTETSDFDLLIISFEKKTVLLDGVHNFPFLTKEIEKKLNRKLQIFVVKDIKELKNNHLINNVLNGITIQGKLKWI